MRRLPLSSERMPTAEGEAFELGEESTHYLRDVLRMSVGDVVEVFDGEGEAWHCTVDAIDGLVYLRATRRAERQVESPLAITLYQAIPKGDRWEWILEKATELGVSRIVPVETKRTVVRISKSKTERKLARWTKIVESAARQSTRTVTPEVLTPRSFGNAMKQEASERVVFCHPGERGEAPSPAPRTVDLWIGPEGGFTDSEVSSLVEASATPLGLGPRVLRVETASLAAITYLQSTWGDL